MINALRSLCRRFVSSLVAEDPVPDQLSGSDILYMYGSSARRAWVDAGTPIVTPTDFEPGGRFAAV